MGHAADVFSEYLARISTTQRKAQDIASLHAHPPLRVRAREPYAGDMSRKESGSPNSSADSQVCNNSTAVQSLLHSPHCALRNSVLLSSPCSRTMAAACHRICRHPRQTCHLQRQAGVPSSSEMHSREPCCTRFATVWPICRSPRCPRREVTRLVS